MKDAIKRLAYTRSVEAEYKAEVTAAQAELETSGVWRYLEQQRGYLETAKADVADAEAKVRKEAMSLFAETGNKTPPTWANMIAPTSEPEFPASLRAFSQLAVDLLGYENTDCVLDVLDENFDVVRDRAFNCCFDQKLAWAILQEGGR